MPQRYLPKVTPQLHFENQLAIALRLPAKHSRLHVKCLFFLSHFNRIRVRPQILVTIPNINVYECRPVGTELFQTDRGILTSRFYRLLGERSLK